MDSFEVSKIITTMRDDSNFVGAQVESFNTNTPYSELACFGGFRFVPWDSNESGACTGLQVFDGSDSWCLPTTDPRMIPHLPDGKPGTNTFASFDGSKCDFGYLDANGYTLIVHDGAQDHVISVNKTTHTISIIQKDGSAIELKNGEVNIRNGTAALSINGSKVQVIGDFGTTGSISQVGGRAVVFADTLATLLLALAAQIDAKTPLPSPPAPGAAVAAVSAALAALPTINTLVN